MITNDVFQSTHPARGCDFFFKGFCVFQLISIHAPRKGVRLFSSSTGVPVSIFQSTHPARGCDVFTRCSFYIDFNFNPRTPQGGATQLWSYLYIWFIISIHAPRKGVRLVVASKGYAEANFNPRTPQGGATISALIFSSTEPFQSTHPARGCDLL